MIRATPLPTKTCHLIFLAKTAIIRVCFLSACAAAQTPFHHRYEATMTISSDSTTRTDTTDLPYNGKAVDSWFSPLPPDAVPDTPGFWVILQGQTLLTPTTSGNSELPHGPLPDGCQTIAEPVGIGLWQGQPLRAVRVASDSALPAGYEALPFFGPDQRLDVRLATLAGRASQIMHWERRSRYCSVCGGETSRIPATWGKRCGECREMHFPHIHPCVIVLVKRGEEFMLIRKAGAVPGRFSPIAGFVDFGESLEECVQREVREEVGLNITNIRYLGSQNWPFPSQQMIGFLADYVDGEPKPDGVEVIEAHWLTGDAIPATSGGSRSIARWMLETFAINGFQP
jgi:NAD+ diphosphatase